MPSSIKLQSSSDSGKFFTALNTSVKKPGSAFTLASHFVKDDALGNLKISLPKCKYQVNTNNISEKNKENQKSEFWKLSVKNEIRIC